VRKILVYDDEKQFTETLQARIAGVAALKGSFRVTPLKQDDFAASVAALSDRQKAFRTSREVGTDQLPLDDADILVVDYDLLSSNAGPLLTGETVAYLARCFSSCGLIIGVNQYGENPFDLTLKGHLESFADLNVGWLQLSNQNLWATRKRGFRPWRWPILPDYLHSFDAKVSDVKASLAQDLPIWQVIGFSPELFDALPSSIAEFVGPDPRTATFRQAVLQSGSALRRKDATCTRNEEVIARVGAARISKWLERWVLPEQDIIVDAPHLVSRYPSLINGDVTDIEAWNKTAELTSHDKLGLRVDVIDPFRLKRDHWISRPVWFWDQLRECEEILEVSEPWSVELPNWAFCEDASRFYDHTQCSEFVADTESPFARRFVRRFKGVQYRPKVRLSL